MGAEACREPGWAASWPAPTCLPSSSSEFSPPPTPATSDSCDSPSLLFTIGRFEQKLLSLLKLGVHR